MAGQRLTDKTALTTTPGTGDLLMIVDVNDTTGSADGTSKKIDNKFFIQTDKINVTNAEFKALDSAGRTLVSSPGAGFGIIPISAYIEQDKGASPNTANIGIRIGHTALDNNYYWTYNRFWPNATYDGGAIILNADNSVKGAISTGTIEDKGLYLYCQTAPSGTSTNTLTVYINYRIIDLS
jgi:hypothetical protein